MSSSSPSVLAVLITSHNRRLKTLDCLGAIFRQPLPAGWSLEIFLVDDASSDGTRRAVEEGFPQVHVLSGDGSLFWNGGMRAAWSAAAEIKPAAYLWLNDDVVLRPYALMQLATKSLSLPSAILIGSCADPATGLRTYGGLRRTGLNPAHVAPVAPQRHVLPCDTFEGNIVWVPAAVYERLGLIARFRHAMGDIDYGYSATRRGVPIRLMEGFLGECSRNSLDGTWVDHRLSRWDRFKKMRQVKGLPPSDWWRFCRRNGGLMAPLFFLSPWGRVIAGK